MVKNILIIEDEEILSRILKDRFQEKGWNVRVAFDGDEGLEVIAKDLPDLILLDLIMPNKDGFAVLKEIRSNPKNKKLPILVLSNLGGSGDIDQALKLGATDYFIKTQHSLSEIVKKAESYLVA